MALRTIREIGDPILNKTSREVTEMSFRNLKLIEDMLDTMYEVGGVGLAAPQVGVLKRIVVIDVTEDSSEPIILVNPVITLAEGEQTGNEGCLSVPGKIGQVTRPDHVIVHAYNEKMEEIDVEGFDLLARAMCHEIDHLDGHLYTEKVEGPLMDVEPPEDEDEE